MNFLKINFGVYDGFMETLRIAAWSGPRNISTAMMRSWENRPDTVVCDEPFYAHYLQTHGFNHPGRDEVLAHHETNPENVIEMLVGPCEQTLQYQKHMTHHLLPSIDRHWISSCTNIFLIRHPREMLTSLVHQIPNPTVEDTGLPQQLALFTSLSSTGEMPLVIDSKDILQNPQAMLRHLCTTLGIPFYKEMLLWPAGKRETDGIWARHWYASVEASTGFAPWKLKEENLPTQLESMCLECIDIYTQLAAHKLNPEGSEHASNI